MTFCDGDQRNLNMLATAFENHDIAVIECQVIATGQIVPVICAVNRQPGGRMELVPFAELFRGDQFERLSPCRADGDDSASPARRHAELN